MLPALFLAAALAAGDDDPGRVDPDRPNIANSTKTVAPRAIQVELGVDAQVHGYASKDSFRVAAPLDVRIGVHKKVELRLFDGDPWHWLGGRIGARQQGELSLGAKIRFYEREKKTKLSLGVQPQLIPVAPFTNAKFWAPLPGAVLLMTVEPGEWSMDFNVGAKMKVASDTGRCCDAEGLVAASFARKLARDRVRLWGEIYTRVDMLKGELSELAGDAGVIVNVTRRVALDVGGLVGDADDTLVAAVLAGMSVRWGP